MNVTVRFGGPRDQFGKLDFEGIVAGSLRRFTHRLKQVYVFLDDVNGPRGGVDKHCRCVLHLRRMPPVVIQDQDEDTYTLIHRVANRATYVLSQKAERQTRRSQQLRSRNPQNAVLAGKREHKVTETEFASRDRGRDVAHT